MEEVFIVVLIVLGVLLDLLIDYNIAKIFAGIAAAKGHNGKPYFWWCFGFGATIALSFVGYLMVIALPDRGSQNAAVKQQESVPEELPEI